MPNKIDIKVGVLGLGHVGLPTALTMAELGWDVIGADDYLDKAKTISQGQTPFHEPDMEEALRKHLDSGKFRVSSDVQSAIHESDVLFVCVGTPQREDGSAELSQVENVARTIAQNLNSFKVIVEKSTTPVRTAERIRQTITRYSDGSDQFEVAVNPEFLREGTAMYDSLNPDRIVLGVESNRAKDILVQLYAPLLERIKTNGESSEGKETQRLILTDLNTAELIKHSANAFLALKISFINMVANLCEETDSDVMEVAKGIGMDPRIGPHFLNAGAGYGGYCLPKDLRAFVRIGEDHRVDMSLLRAVEEINKQRVEMIVSKLKKALWVLQGKTIGIWGLSFKSGTDDIREAPSLKIISRLLEEGSNLKLHDPKAMVEFRNEFKEIPERLAYCETPEDAAQGADAVLIVTEWPEYRELDFERIKQDMVLPMVIDGRNILDPGKMKSLGFEYYGMGR